MRVSESTISGVYVIDVEKREDNRGFFARTWDPSVAKERGLQEHFDYTCISFNIAPHTLRGMHYQTDPHGETKLVRCTKGSMFDVAVDLRPDSPTFKQWFGAELSADNRTALYVPTGCAHGFLTLEPDTEVLYQIAGGFVSDASGGVRWNDPAFDIQWPAEPAVNNDRDATYPDFVP